MSHEKSVTFNVNGKWVNAPSVVGGVTHSEDTIRQLYLEGKIKSLGEFDSLEEAVGAAKKRSKGFEYEGLGEDYE